jgi:hypothetical protein
MRWRACATRVALLFLSRPAQRAFIGVDDTGPHLGGLGQQVGRQALQFEIVGRCCANAPGEALQAHLLDAPQRVLLGGLRLALGRRAQPVGLNQENLGVQVHVGPARLGHRRLVPPSLLDPPDGTPAQASASYGDGLSAVFGEDPQGSEHQGVAAGLEPASFASPGEQCVVGDLGIVEVDGRGGRQRALGVRAHGLTVAQRNVSRETILNVPCKTFSARS